mmetsp:Transcript_16007/g.24119  ORF Transcript_16007/g.24119 Transcript_16007/m.24119 type:complete len:313 (-) Transcript_16007:32-970(-)
MSAGDEESQVLNYPHNTKFKQQGLDAWQPIATFKNYIVTLIIVGVAFLAIGVALYEGDRTAREFSARYDDSCPASGNGSIVTSCNITINIDQDLDNSYAPLRFSYGLTNYFQAYRRYVKSRSDWQLANVGGPIDICDPLENSGGDTLYPCGLVANSFFNDTFVAEHCSGSTCEVLTGDNWKQTDISWQSDRDQKFEYRQLKDSETNIGPGGFVLPNVTNEEFIVWMRVSGLPSFRKLYSTVDRKLSKGDRLVIRVNSNFPVSSFDGTKQLFVEEVTWMNGKNSFLGILYLVIGCLCLAGAIAFSILHKIKPR